MQIKASWIPLLIIPLLMDLNKCENNPSKKRITVIGTAVMMKNDPAVRNSDSVFYYLDHLREWDEKFLGRKVKLTGRLIIIDYPGKHKSSNPLISAIPQQNYGKRYIIEKPKWTLIE